MAGAAAALPQLLSEALAQGDAEPRRYGRARLVGPDGAPLKSKAIPVGQNLIFHYPFAGTPCFLLDLGVADRAVRCDALLDAAASDLDAVSESELVELGLLVAQPLIRDIALRRLNREGTWRNVDLWQRVVQTLPAIEQGPVLPVLGIACWVAGEGVMKSLCVERARLLVPNDRLVGLLDQSTTMALPPWFWFEVLDQLDGTVAV